MKKIISSVIETNKNVKELLINFSNVFLITRMGYFSLNKLGKQDAFKVVQHLNLNYLSQNFCRIINSEKHFLKAPINSSLDRFLLQSNFDAVVWLKYLLIRRKTPSN